MFGWPTTALLFRSCGELVGPLGPVGGLRPPLPPPLYGVLYEECMETVWRQYGDCMDTLKSKIHPLITVLYMFVKLVMHIHTRGLTHEHAYKALF